MKKILILIAVLFTPLVIPFTVSAQSGIASEVDYFKNDLGDNAIIRSDHNYSGSLIYYEDSDGRSYFLYRHKDPTEPTCRFTWPNHTSIDQQKYKIFDVVIGEDTCYFCGSYINNLTTTPDTVGLVGWADLQNIAHTPCSLATIYFNFCTIPGTRVFTQMDGYFDHSQHIAQLCMVGESYSSTAPSCAAFVKWNRLLTTWNYRLVGTLDTNETLTDISFSGLGTKVVAVSRYANEPYKFGLRGEYTSNIFDFILYPTLTNFTHRNTVNTYGLYLASSSNPHPTWHANDIVARIVCPPNSEEFTVAYECVDNTKTCETKQQVALFRIDVSTFPWNYNMNLTGKQIVRGYFEESSTFTDMLYIPDNKTFALLHRSKNSSNGKSAAVQFPTWLNYGQINTLISDVALHSSMDIRDFTTGRYLTLVGDHVDDNNICFFRQALNDLGTSCYQTNPVSVSEELILDDWSTYQGVRTINDSHGSYSGTPAGGNTFEAPLYNTCKSYEQ